MYLHGKHHKIRVGRGEEKLCPGRMGVEGLMGTHQSALSPGVPINQSKVPLGDKQIQSLTF